MYIYKPKRETKAHIVLPVFFILISAAAMVCSRTALIPAFIMQAVAVVSIALAIHIISRYSLTDHTYEADTEKRVFNVRKVTGRKISHVAAVEYSDIIAVDKKEKGYSLKEKYNKAYKIYNFCNNIFPAEAYCLVCDIEGEDIAVIIEADKMLLDILERR
ncbi:MAG: hypothetical protein IJA55_05255 [Clostridia bacterium]|nr:hypothetical protein [Clostridia bacterium]